MAASAASGSAFGSHKQHGANQQPQAPYNQVKVITVDKHFLISNRSSHTSAFSAIAELVRAKLCLSQLACTPLQSCTVLQSLAQRRCNRQMQQICQ